MAKKFKRLFVSVAPENALINDVLVGAAQGKIWMRLVTPTTGRIGHTARVYRPRPGQPPWLGQFVVAWFNASTEQIHRRYSRGAGSGGGHLSLQALADVEVPTPDAADMQKIVEISRLTGQLEELSLKKIATMREMIRALAHHKDVSDTDPMEGAP